MICYLQNTGQIIQKGCEMDIQIVAVAPEDFASVLDGIADVLMDSVNNGASVNFVPPITHDDAREFWQRIESDITQEKTALWIAKTVDRIVGTIVLAMAWQPNAPHRAEVQKMLVHSDYRRRGIASRLLQTLEEDAIKRDRWLLFLDTEADSDAPYFYHKMGYQDLGIMPKHALNHNGEFADTLFLYKLLNQ